MPKADLMRPKLIGLILLLGGLFTFAFPLDAQQDEFTAGRFQAAVEEAIDLYVDGDFEGAIERFTDALDYAASPVDEAFVYNWRGFIYLVSGDLESAVPDLERAVRLDSASGIYYIDRSIAYAAIGRDTPAVLGFERALELAPAFAYPSSNRRDRDYYEDNISSYSYLLDLQPDNFIILAFRGNLYALTEQYDLAISDYEAVLDQIPDFEIVQESLAAVERATAPEPVEPEQESSLTDCSIAGIDGLPIINTGETLEGNIDTLLYIYLYCLRIDDAPVTVTFTMTRADGDLLPLVGVYNDDDLIASTELYYPIGTSEVELVITFDTPGDYLLAATRLNVRNGFSFGNFVLTIRTEGGGTLPAVCENPTFQDINKCRKAEERLGE